MGATTALTDIHETMPLEKQSAPNILSKTYHYSKLPASVPASLFMPEAQPHRQLLVLHTHTQYRHDHYYTLLPVVNLLESGPYPVNTNPMRSCIF